MKGLKIFLILLIGILAGCSSMKEGVKGFLGVSTKVLEDHRKDAIKKEFNYDLVTSHSKIMKIIRQDMVNKNVNSLMGNKGMFGSEDTEDNVSNRVYVYEDNLKQDFIACYLTETDTTPVGIFLTETGKGKTLVEVSSPSTYAKETIANTIFKGLTDSLKVKEEKGSN
ncbi:MAG: hypothetical protein NTZ63_03315 [Candidatus Omnitrophica bacterium]|nr:hypothetical protein [Candidatus Omnitrophota bacterium]